MANGDHSTMLELGAKVAAGVATASALVGITYNVAFFFGEKQSWLFYLSVTDNVTASLYALPFVAFGVILVTISIAIQRLYEFEPPPPGSPQAKRLSIFRPLFWFWMLGLNGLLIVLETPQDRWRTAAFLILGAALSLLPVLASRLVRGKIGQGIDYKVKLFFAAILVGLPLVASVCLFAQSDRHRIDIGGRKIEVEIADRNRLYGSLVRSLEGGLILALGSGHWIWLPRSEIKRVTEITTLPSMP